MKIMTMCESMGHKRFKCPHEFTKHDRTLQKKSLAHNFARNTEYRNIQNTFHSSIRPYQDYQWLSGTECLTHMRKNCLGRSAFLLTCDAALPFTLSVRRFTVWLRLLCTPHDTVLHTLCALCFELILKLIFFYSWNFPHKTFSNFEIWSSCIRNFANSPCEFRNSTSPPWHQRSTGHRFCRKLMESRTRIWRQETSERIYTVRSTVSLALDFQRRSIFQLFWQRRLIGKDGVFSLFICTPFFHLFSPVSTSLLHSRSLGRNLVVF